jgi:hypothetical protein
VGVDHRYTFEGEPNEENILVGDDPNHFDPDYFRDQSWHNPDLEKSEEAYVMALDAYSAMGRYIINLTPNTALDVFEKGGLDAWMVSNG